MIHRAWRSIVEVPYCFSRSYVKFQGHTALKIVEFDPNWAFPDSNSSLNSPMAMKYCTKLETAKERCPIVFQGHPSNFKVTRDKTPPILTQIGRFRTIGRSQLSNVTLKLFYMSQKEYPDRKFINQSLITGIFPEKLKGAKVLPLFKKGDETLIENHRPVSLLTSISKVFEKVVFIQLSKYF